MVVALYAAPMAAPVQAQEPPPGCGWCMDDWHQHNEEEAHWRHTFVTFQTALFACEGEGSVGCHLYDYYYNVCSTHHGDCQISEEATLTLAAALEARDGPEVERIIEQYPHLFIRREHLKAIEVRNCDGVPVDLWIDSTQSPAPETVSGA
ncbi:MAG: hypothetical protein WEB88_04645 [Gemmatimonadota bacterium]